MNQNQPQNSNNSVYSNLQQSTEAPPKKKRSCLKTCGLIVLFFILLLGGGYGYFSYRIRTAKDIASINDADLRLEKVSIPDEENSYFELVKIKDVLYYPENKEEQNKIIEIDNGKSWDEDYVKNLVSKNEKALSYFDEFDRKPKFIDPASADPGKLDVNTVVLSDTATATRKIARIQSLEALLLVKQDKNEEAFNKSLKILRLSYKLSNYQPTLIQYLLGLSTANIGWSRLNAVISAGGMSAEFLQDKKDDLMQFKSTSEGLKKALMLEYMIMAKTLTEDILANKEDIQKAATSNLPLDKMPSNFYFQPNKTKQEYADWVREQIKISDKPCDQITPSATSDISKQSKYKLLLTENAIGKILINLATPSLSNLQVKRCETENLAEQAINKIK